MPGGTLISAGGQAVIEGVMMRSPTQYAIAVRRPDGKISIKEEKIHSLATTYPILKLPFLRGMLALVEMLILGMRALTYSANEAVGEEEEELGFWDLFISIVLVLAFALLFFKYVPLLIAQYFQSRFAAVAASSILFSLIDGIVKTLLFLLYIVVISFSKDVKRVFAYHGAEHKAVYCYENRKKLNVRNVQAYQTMHPRCGTSFILYVLLLSIFVYAFIPNTLPLAWKYVWRILLLPVIAGISFEILKYSAKHRQNFFFHVLTLPGLAMQKLTTREPENKQVEVAIKALKAVIR